MKQTALKRDEEQVQAILNHLNETMTDPFDIEAHPPWFEHIKYIYRHPSRVICTVSNEEIGQHFL
jgi:hypothetical protein